MNYINPFELLGIDSLEKNEIRKAKRRKLAEIELSEDGSLIHDGNQVTKSELLRITSELDDSQKIQYHLNLLSVPKLLDFLRYGDLSFFEEDMDYPLFDDRRFIDFLTPYFVDKFSWVYKKAFEDEDLYTLRILSKGEDFVDSGHQDKMYKDVYQTIKRDIEDWKNLKEDMHQGYDESEIFKLPSTIQRSLKIKGLNALPPYFQKIRNDYALAIRDISVAVFNEFYESKVALNILDLSSALKINNLTKSRIDKDMKEIREIHQDQQEARKYEDQLKKQAEFLILLRRINEGVEEGEYSPSEVKSIVNRELDLQSLEDLPSSFQEIRNQVALGLRNLSVVVWNKFEDIHLSTWIITLGFKIELEGEALDRLDEAQSQLAEIKEDQEKSVIATLNGINRAYREVRKSSNQYIDSGKVQQVLKKILTISSVTTMASFSLSAKKQILHELSSILKRLSVSYANSVADRMELMVGDHPELKKILSTLRRTEKNDKGYFLPIAIVGLILLFLYLKYNEPEGDPVDYTPSNTPPASSYNEDISSKLTEDSQANPSIPKPSNRRTPPPVSPYKGNQLKNGASPLNACFGSGLYHETSSWVLMKNGNTTDVIVCLVDVYSGRTIRNEYIRAGDSFKMTKLPNGTYYMKVFYGNDWNPTTKNACGSSGNFEKNRSFSVSDSPDDYLKVRDDGYSYTYGEVTLYSVANGNMDSRGISEEQFFN